MSTKKSKRANQLTKSPKKQNVRNQGPTSKADTEKFTHTKVKELMNKKVRSPLLKEIMAHADICSILNDTGNALQEDFEEDSFNPPLHSTAVYSGDDELLQANENSVEIPAKHVSPVPPEVREKSMRPNHKELKRKSAVNTEHSDHRSDAAKQKRTPQKKPLHVQEPGPSKRLKTVPDGTPSSKQTPSTTPNRNLVSDTSDQLSHQVFAKKTKTQRKEPNSASKKKSRKEKMEKAPADTWSPENMPKSVRNVNELDVVLFESGKLIELYRENVETDVCKRAIDVFFDSFKEQLSTTILNLRKLKDLKRKNAKMHLEIGRKRKRLLEVKNEIIMQQPKLNQLQKECSELEKKQVSLKSARAFLDNLAHLQDDYMKFKTENPHIKETYGTSSLPAMCLEAENIMKAEQHFHIVNTKLQSFIDKEKGHGKRMAFAPLHDAD